MNVFTLSFAVLLALKLFGTIDWSWWAVTAPLWGGYVVILVACAFGALLVRDRV